jgi:Skp family chaperone for outer membrane proteins
MPHQGRSLLLAALTTLGLLAAGMPRAVAQDTLVQTEEQPQAGRSRAEQSQAGQSQAGQSQAEQPEFGAAVPQVLMQSTPDEDGEGFPVLVVDMQEVRQRSSAVQDVRTQIQDRREAYEAELTELERTLQQDQRDLLERRSEMSSEDYNAAVQKLDSRLTEARRSMRATKANLDRLFNRGMLEIDRVIVSVAEEIAVGRNARLVLPKAGVLLVRNDLEVTEDVIAEVNERLPELDLATLTPRP